MTNLRPGSPKKERGLNKQNKKWKRRNINQYHRNTKNHKRILWTTTCQQIWQPRRYGQLSRNIKPTKIESTRNKIIWKPENWKWNRICNKKKNSIQTKVQDQTASQANSTKHTKKNFYHPFSNSFRRLKRREHSQRHSMKPPSTQYQNQTLPKKEITG